MIDFNLNSIVIFIVSSLAVYILIKIIIRIFDYIIFKKLSSVIIDSIFDDDNNDENSDSYKKNFTTEDEWMKDKDKIKEQKRAEEKQFWHRKNNRQLKTRIVGIAKNAVLGKWTALVMKRMAGKMRFMDPKEVEEKGFYQAMVLAERRMNGVNKSKFNGMGK